MKYVFDESAICYMLESFPKNVMPELWKKFEDCCNNGIIITDKETKNSLSNLLEESDSYTWMDDNTKLFKGITQKESKNLGELIEAGIFKFYSNSMEIIRNLPIALPFLITMAFTQERVFVINKKTKDLKKIEKICEEKNINLLFVEDFLMKLKEE